MNLWKNYIKSRDKQIKLEIFIIVQKINNDKKYLQSNKKKYLQSNKKIFTGNLFTAHTTTNLKRCYKKYKELNMDNIYIYKVKLDGKYIKTDDFTEEAELSHKLNLL